MIDWHPLLAGRTDGFTTAAFGVEVGDSVDATLLDRATKVELHEQAGQVHVGEISYEIQRGTVCRIRVRGAPLAELPFRVEADIERAFGASVAERRPDWVGHRFPALGLAVGWQVGEERVEHVALGSVAWPHFGWGTAENRLMTEIDDDGLSPEGRAALVLLISEAFLQYPGLSAEDHALAAEGVRRAWECVEGGAVDGYDLCEYIDGEIGLPNRIPSYENGSMPQDVLFSAIHAIGIVASLAGGDSESVAEFNEIQWWCMRESVEKLTVEEQRRLARDEGTIRAAPAISRRAIVAARPFEGASVASGTIP